MSLAANLKVTDTEKRNWVVVSGGARSGKSHWAASFAKHFQNVLWIATADTSAADDELLHRIQQQKFQRSAVSHSLIELLEVQELAALNLDTRVKQQGVDLVVLDSLTLLMAAELSRAISSYSHPQLSTHLASQMTYLNHYLSSSNVPVLIITSEVGEGVVPGALAGRIFRDALGAANQNIVSQAAFFLHMMSGVPIVLKGSRFLSLDSARNSIEGEAVINLGSCTALVGVLKGT